MKLEAKCMKIQAGGITQPTSGGEEVAGPVPFDWKGSDL